MGYRSSRHRTTSRGAIALALVAGLVAVIMAMSFTGSLQVSSTCALMERAHSYRLLDLASESCFEEASAALEKQFGTLEFPESRKIRDLGTILAWPATIDTPIARGEYSSLGVVVGAVSVTSSPWLMFQAVTPEKSRVSQERGVLQLEVDVRVQAGSASVARHVIARRYMSLEPPPSGENARLVVQGTNILRELRGL